MNTLISPENHNPHSVTTPVRRALLRQLGVLAGSLSLGLPGAMPPAYAAGKEDELVIGQSAPLSGVLADTGREMVLGGQIYFDHLNSQGGVQGRKLRHLVLDDGYEVERTLTNTRELLDQHNAIALFGYAGTGNIQRLLADKVLANAGAVMVGPYTGGEPLRTPYNPNIFHIRAGYADEAATMIKLLTGVGIRRIAVFYQDDAFGQAGLQGVVDALATHGLELAASASYPKNTDQVDTAVQAIAARQPQAVILISVNKSSAAFVQKYRSISKSTQLFNISVVTPKAIAHIVGADDTRGFAIAQVVPDPFSNALPAAREYRSLLAQYGKGAEPSTTSFEEFLAAKTLVEGLKRAKTLSRAGLMAGLESIDRLDLGGYIIGFGPGNRRGSRFVEMATVGRDGRLMR
jgi:branched-chain amino acid transport system substrate-binding protein